jgi:hypothetical protein
MADPPPYPNSSSDTGSTPRWVKVFGIIVIVLVLLFVVLKVTGLGGRHGPGRHTPSGDAGGQTPPANVIGDAPPKGGYG